MQTIILKALWGMSEGATIDDKLRMIRDAGYNGVECPKPAEDPSQWKDLCAKYNLDYIGMIFADEPKAFSEQLKAVLAYQPILVNAHSGRDKMTFESGSAFFSEVIRMEKDAGVGIAHETHRLRIFFSPWSTIPYLEKFPDLKICADFSHWTVVCESMMHDMDDYLKLACTRALHVHGRVGYEEGPQVPDPRAPEYQRHVERFESWWDAIRQARKAASASFMTYTPEFGPPGYMHTLPYTQQPVANLWDVCLHMANRERERWKV